MDPQIIAGSWVNERKLKQLLSRKFGREYRLHVGAFAIMHALSEGRLKLLPIAHTGHSQMRSNTYKIYADERLTEAEIMTCC